MLIRVLGRRQEDEITPGHWPQGPVPELPTRSQGAVLAPFPGLGGRPAWGGWTAGNLVGSAPVGSGEGRVG